MWIPIIAAIIDVFGPYLAKWLAAWLEHMLHKAAAKLPAPAFYPTPRAAHMALVEVALRWVPLLANGRRRLLRSIERAANNLTADEPVLQHHMLDGITKLELTSAATEAEAE